MENLDGQRKIYRKANSFLEMRGQEGSRAKLLEKLRSLSATLPPASDRSYLEQIVARACADILEPDTAATGARFELHAHVIAELDRLPDEMLPRYLFYRYRYDLYPVEHKTDHFPPCLQIEPTSICNYRCVFCYQTDPGFNTPKEGFMGMMTLDLFKKVVDEARGNCEAVTLASRGEPLMCREIEPMLAYISGKFLAVKMNTNAWYLDERKAHAILQAGINTLVFSADAAKEPLYSQLRVRGNLERVLKNIRQFREIQSKHYSDSPLITRVAGVRFSAEQSLDSMEGLWGELVDQVAFVDYNPWENVYESPLSNVETPCSDLWRRMFVWYDGTVNPCDVDYKSKLAAGNAKEKSLTELWTGEPYQSYRKSHLARKRSELSPCQRCTVI